jgi:hypothetical protein
MKCQQKRPNPFGFTTKNVDRSNPAGKYKKRKEITKSKGQMYLRIFWELFSNPPFLSMASLQHSLLTRPPPCCCSYALLHQRTRKFSNGPPSTAKPFLRRDFSERGGTLAWKIGGRRRLGVTGVGKGPFFGGGRRQGSTARTVGNLAFVALVAYLAVSGQFRWLLDAIVSLWVHGFFL